MLVIHYFPAASSREGGSTVNKAADLEPSDRLKWALIAWAVVAVITVTFVLPRESATPDVVAPTEPQPSVSSLVNLGNLAMGERTSDPAALERALEHFRSGHELDPDHLDARFGLAWARHVKGLPETEWRGLYEQTVADASLLTYLSLFNLAYAEGEAGRYPEAAALLEQALRVMPERADGLVALGTNHAAMRDNALAVRDFQRATELDPDYSRAFFLLGQAHSALGRDTEAEAAWSRALVLNPAWEERIEAARAQ